jgi:hypothetical protein
MKHALALALTVTGLTLSAPGHAAERRCGWVDNPTPGNWWLTDRQGEWTIGVQGGQLVAGIDNMPDMATKGWVATNGNYGYGCGCMTVETNARDKKVTRIISATPVPLRQCRADRNLPKH